MLGGYYVDLIDILGFGQSDPVFCFTRIGAKRAFKRFARTEWHGTLVIRNAKGDIIQKKEGKSLADIIH